MMKRYFYFILLLTPLLFSCQESKNESSSMLYGDWQFLNSRGDYNEAFFSDSTYLSYNIKNGLFPMAHYFVRNDTLFSDVDRRSKGQKAIAKFASIEKNRVIIINVLSQDTLYRIKTKKNVLSNAVFPADEPRFKGFFMRRYKEFLLERGIINKDEGQEE